jgi:hypothetical protein
MLHFFRVQAQQMPNCRRSRQRARGTRGVEHLVVRAAQKLPHPNAYFIAHDRCSQEAFPTGSKRLRHRQRHWEDDSGGVKHRAVMHIILFGHMRGRRIDHGRHVGAGAGSVNQHFTSALHRPHGSTKMRDALHRPCTLARQCRTKPVDQQIFGLANHSAREYLQTSSWPRRPRVGLCSYQYVRQWVPKKNQMARVERNAAMSASVRPSSRKTASVCSPIAGIASIR